MDKIKEIIDKWYDIELSSFINMETDKNTYLWRIVIRDSSIHRKWIVMCFNEELEKLIDDMFIKYDNFLKKNKLT